MPRKPGAVNKSAAIRDILTSNPGVKAKDAVSSLAQQDIKITPGLFYFIKGKMKGSRGRRRKMRRDVATVMGSSEGTGVRNGDVLSTIRKVKGLAAEVGGLRKLKALVEALSD